jgi:PAS domain-containing protein
MGEVAHDSVWLDHPSLACAALSARPAWLWSLDATRLLWANPVGAAIFAAPLSAAIRASLFGSRGPAAVEVARLAATLRADETRLARLRGLGAGLGGVLACACSRITLADQSAAVLVAATEAAGQDWGQDWPLAERVRRLLVPCGEPVAAFSASGELIHASPPARLKIGGAATLMGIGAEGLAAEARRKGRARGMSTVGPLTIERVEVEASTILLAVFRSAAGAFAPPTHPPGDPKPARQPPRRFVWQIDAEGRFTIESPAFLSLAGAATQALLGRPFEEIASALGLDRDRRVAAALATRDTFSGLGVAWPVADGLEQVRVELSGLPVFDRERAFRGYRGFGIWRDFAPVAGAGGKVVPLRPGAEAPSLNAVERNAFHELTRRLRESLEQPPQSGNAER